MFQKQHLEPSRSPGQDLGSRITVWSAQRRWPLAFQKNAGCRAGSLAHLLADLARDVRLQPAREDLVYDAVAVVGVVGLLPVIVTWGKITAVGFASVPRVRKLPRASGRRREAIHLQRLVKPKCRNFHEGTGGPLFEQGDLARKEGTTQLAYFKCASFSPFPKIRLPST